MVVRFEWDEAKVAGNLAKHGISFETASRVFADPLALTRVDRVQDGEQRWQTLGTVNGVYLLVVAHTTTEGEDTEWIRIISARPAESWERKGYEEENS